MSKKAKRTTKRSNILINVIIVLSIILLYQKFFKKASTSSASTSSCPCATNREGLQHHQERPEKDRVCDNSNIENIPSGYIKWRCNGANCTNGYNDWDIPCEDYHNTEYIVKCNKYYNDPNDCPSCCRE